MIGDEKGTDGSMTDLQKLYHFERHILLSFRQSLDAKNSLVTISPGVDKEEIDNSPRISLGGKTTPSGGLLTSSGRVGVDDPFPFVTTAAMLPMSSLLRVGDCDGAFGSSDLRVRMQIVVRVA